MLALFWCFFWFCFVLCFCLLYCFGSSLWKKGVFPATLVFFWVLLVKRVVWFYVLCFCYCLFVLCCFFHFKEFICIILLLGCFFCDKTKWSSCLHLVVLLPFLFFVVLFWILSFFCCFHSSQKRTPQKTGHSKNPKKQKCRKTRQKKKSVSAVVFTDSVLNFSGWA